MKAFFAMLLTASLWIGCYILSALIYFDISWVLVAATSIWAAIDSKKIELTRYKLSFSCSPIVVFCCCYLLWIIAFPWYLWERFKIKAGEATLKSGLPENAGAIRRFFNRSSRVIDRLAAVGAIGLVGLKIALMLFLIEECWRGQRAWDSYRHELEAKGQSFDWGAMIPSPVKDSQNIFNAPKMAAWFINPSGKVAMTEDLSARLNYTNSSRPVMIAEVTMGVCANSEKTDVPLHFGDAGSERQAKELVENIAGSGVLGARGNALVAARPINLNQFKPLHLFVEADHKPNVGELLQFFGGNHSGSGPLFLKPAGTNCYQLTASFCTASDYLKWSDQFKPDFDAMREAVKRPYARMDGDYQFPPTIPLPNCVAIRAVAQTLAQRAQCYLLLGQPEKALQELTLIYDLRRLLQGAPSGKPMTLVAAMMNAIVVELYVTAVADGFRLQAWQEPQLTALQKQLEQISLAPFVKEAIHGEEVNAWRVIQTVVMVQLETRRIPGASLLQKIKNVRPPNLLKGIVLLNVVSAVRMQQTIYESIDLAQQTVRPEKIAEFQEIEKAFERQILPYKLFAVIFVPNFGKAIQTFGFIQTRADEAQIVCALERYHLAHGQYPETLNELAPQFIGKLPHDIIRGEPLKYRRTSDGHFMLYSVGWNETDDGGRFSLPPYDQGDWTWL